MSFNYYHEPLRPAPVSSCSSIDEEEFNIRISPDWNHYRALLESRGYHLDTIRDVRLFYEQYLGIESTQQTSKSVPPKISWRGYPADGEADDDLCKDRGLPDNLFRGTRLRDGKKLMIKAVNAYSHELDVIRFLTSPVLRDEPGNRTIPVLDIISVPQDKVALIVQEEWSCSIERCAPCSPRAFLQAMRQCIEGIHFMHAHRVAHLDVSRSNILTNCAGSYAYIDFELSRRYSSEGEPSVRGIRGTELPPEIERGDESSPFKVDIWALGVTLLRACKATGFDVPRVSTFIRPMLSERPLDRPTVNTILQEFDRTFLLHDSWLL
ncbi:kinase-like protein [Hysterangium stoloniferum]|nr:kinase-like protein [Hysterangium stoloniferum]